MLVAPQGGASASALAVVAKEAVAAGEGAAAAGEGAGVLAPGCWLGGLPP